MSTYVIPPTVEDEHNGCVRITPPEQLLRELIIAVSAYAEADEDHAEQLLEIGMEFNLAEDAEAASQPYDREKYLQNADAKAAALLQWLQKPVIDLNYRAALALRNQLDTVLRSIEVRTRPVMQFPKIPRQREGSEQS